MNVLVVDFLGALAKIYRYGRWAYVGGGFTPYLHSVLEPVAYGLPVAFGPRIERKTAPTEMVCMGIGTIVRKPKDLLAWYQRHAHDEALLRSVRKQAEAYIAANTNVTRKIVSLLHATE